MSKLMDKLLKGGMDKVKTSLLSKSTVYDDVDFIPTEVPMINAIFSGRMDGGITGGVTLFAAKSKHFKTGFLLLCVRSFFQKHPDGVCLFYDSEFGAPQAYFRNFQVDPDRVAHAPFTDIEMLKKDFVRKLDTFEKGDPIIVIIDSLGMVSSKKELEDTLKKDDDTTDMTRTKSLKSFFRMITPQVKMKNIPVIISQHTYQNQGTAAFEIVAGGRGQEFAADNIFIVGREQDKNKTSKEVDGNEFILKVNKSRFVKEGLHVGVYVSQEEGIYPWSGLLPMAIEGGFVIQDGAYYQKAGEEKTYHGAASTNNAAFWAPILRNPEFQMFVTTKFMLAQKPILANLEDEVDAVDAGEEKAETFAQVKKKAKRGK